MKRNRKFVRKLQETGSLGRLSEAGGGDPAHRAAVWCSLEQSLIDDTVDQWPTRWQSCELVFESKADILNMLCDYQFFFLCT